MSVGFAPTPTPHLQSSSQGRSGSSCWFGSRSPRRSPSRRDQQRGRLVPGRDRSADRQAGMLMVTLSRPRSWRPAQDSFGRVGDRYRLAADRDRAAGSKAREGERGDRVVSEVRNQGLDAVRRHRDGVRFEPDRRLSDHLSRCDVDLGDRVVAFICDEHRLAVWSCCESGRQRLVMIGFWTFEVPCRPLPPVPGIGDTCPSGDVGGRGGGRRGSRAGGATCGEAGERCDTEDRRG